MTKLRVCIVLLFCAAAVAAPAQTFTTLAIFGETTGMGPLHLTQGFDGNFYGTTYYGVGGGGHGTVFKVTRSGTLTTLYQFCSLPNCADGENPVGAIIQGADGHLYGTTSGDGGHGDGGTVFKLTLAGSLSTLYSFCAQANCTDGNAPITGLVEGSDGSFYGSTEGGGTYGYGTIFKITRGGILSTLHDFDSVDGYQPSGTLVEVGDGSLFGTTIFGGAPLPFLGSGTAFKITPTGSFTTLHTFCTQPNCSDGANPNGGLIQASDGNLYGVTIDGGASSTCSNGCGYGTIFRISPSGAFSLLFSFDETNGNDPDSGLIQATDGNFYGTTNVGGSHGEGTIFGITPRGAFTDLYDFCSQASCADGEVPWGGLTQGTDGTFYGAAYEGGSTLNYGTVFSLSEGLGPFVETLPSIRKEGASIHVLGNSLTGSTAVSFNGTAATFAVVSDTEITATVPAGATNGFVTVTTPSGTLKSNKPFRVIP